MHWCYISKLEWMQWNWYLQSIDKNKIKKWTTNIFAFILDTVRTKFKINPLNPAYLGTWKRANYA